MDQVEEIKEKLDIVNVVNEYVQMRKAGVNWKARCPFHNEKTPSFMVNPDRQIFHCFGCNEGGDMFTFIQKIEGVDFPEALRLLAAKAGVRLEKTDPRVISLKNKLIDICSAACLHWQEILTRPEGQIARDYIERRKLKKETVEQFKIGYALESWDDLSKFLLGKGFKESEIFQAGLSVMKEQGTGYYDRFRGRLIFPIEDIHGNVVGFSGRILTEEKMAKYINTPESQIYHKGRILYGLDKAKQTIREQGYVVIVEGNMDVIACHQAGYKNVVACSGTALTPDQIGILKRYTENAMLCFDQDEAGQLAARRSIDLLLAEEMNIKIVQLVYGKDPDECIKNNPKDWEASLRTSKLIMQFYFDKFLTPDIRANIAKKKQAAKIILAEIIKLKNKIELDHWLKELAERLDVAEDILRESLPQRLAGKPDKTKEEITAPRGKTREQDYLERVFTILISRPKLIGYASDNLLPEMVSDASLNRFYINLIIYYNEARETISRESTLEWLSQNDNGLDKNYVDSLIVYVDKIYEGFDDARLQQELVDLVRNLKRSYLEQKVGKLRGYLAAAEKIKNDAEADKLSKEIQIESENLAKLK